MNNSFQELTLCELQETDGGVEQILEWLFGVMVDNAINFAVTHKDELLEGMKPVKNDPMFDTPYYKIFSTTCP